MTNYSYPTYTPYPAYPAIPYPYPYQQPVQPQQPAQQNAPQQPYQQEQNQQQHQYQPPILDGGFVPVQSEEQARLYPVQPGRCVTFRDINAPYCYTKTQARNAFEPFEFKRYRVEEEKEVAVKHQEPAQMPQEQPVQPLPYAMKTDVEALTGDVKKAISGIEGEVSELREMLGSLIANKKPASSKKKEDDD